ARLVACDSVLSTSVRRTARRRSEAELDLRTPGGGRPEDLVVPECTCPREDQVFLVGDVVAVHADRPRIARPGPVRREVAQAVASCERSLSAISGTSLV